LTRAENVSRSEPVGDAEDARHDLVMGLVASPGLPSDVARRLADTLPERLEEVFPEVHWVVPVAVDSPIPAGADGVEVVDAVRRRLLSDDWDLAILLTDLPFTIRKRPVVAHLSTSHGVGLVSLPSLGARHLTQRAQDAVVRMIDGLLGESVAAGSDRADGKRRLARVRSRLRNLAVPVRRAEIDGDTIRLVTAVVRGNLRLLAGMIRHNQPWRLITRLSRALSAALAAAAFALVTSDVWRLAGGSSWVRLLVIALVSTAVTVVSIIVAHELWERSRDGVAREQVILFNFGTAATISIGVITMYAGLFVLTFGSALLLVTTGPLEQTLGRPVDFGDYVRLAWLVSSLATVGGALGAALETDLAVREAAYAYRLDERDEEQGADAAMGDGASAP
jgi:hypothetical protein